MTVRTMAAGLGSMALLGLFSLAFPAMLDWLGQYQMTLQAMFPLPAAGGNADGPPYHVIVHGQLPEILTAAMLFAMVAVLWPVE